VAQSFKETAHLRTDKKAYDEGWDRIFGSKEVSHLKCDDCEVQDETVSIRIDPYVEELYGEKKEVQICDNCYNESCLAI
jgi:hypothetical protein